VPFARAPPFSICHRPYALAAPFFLLSERVKTCCNSPHDLLLIPGRLGSCSSDPNLMLAILLTHALSGAQEKFIFSCGPKQVDPFVRGPRAGPFFHKESIVEHSGAQGCPFVADAPEIKE